MATIIKGLLSQDLPWGLIFVGMGISVVVELCGIRSLSFAVGAYLPLATTLPIFIGGALRGLVDKQMGSSGSESEVSSGMLYSTGLVAGGSLTGILIAALSGIPTTVTVDGQPQEISILQRVLDMVGIHGWESLGAMADLIGVVAFVGLCFLLIRAAREKLEA
jgi:hypothetical protein